jgi:uroporphyrinogen-III synthase
MRVLVTRPAGDGEAFAAALEARGIESLVAPIMSVRFDDDAALDLDGVQAVLVTSANGVRALARLTARRDLDLLAVGPQTAREARDLGFAGVGSAGGDVERLAELVLARLRPAGGRLLHVAGSVVAGDLQGRLAEAGFTVDRVVAYRAEAVDILPETIGQALISGRLNGAVFFSARTAALFVKLIQEAGFAGRLADLAAFCLSPAVADALAPSTFARILVAEQPQGDRLLDLICFAATD